MAQFSSRLRMPIGLLLMGLLASMLAFVPSASVAGPPETLKDKVRVVTYRGHGADIRRASGDVKKLRKTSVAFRTAVTRRLDRMWKQGGSKPACAKAPLITVKRWRSDGWARISNIGMFAPCPSGGAWEIWRAAGKKHLKYKTVLGGQDHPTCRQLRRKHVPAGIWDSCFSADGVVVPYKPSKPFTAIAGRYAGHTRLLTVTAAGRAHEVIYAGCCEKALDVVYRLSHLRRSGERWTATAKVSKVNYVNESYYADPPAVGDRTRLRVKRGVAIIRGVSYCLPSAPAGTCGA